MIDPIVEEVRAIREACAAKFNFDLYAIFQDLRKLQENCGWKVVSFAPRLIEQNPADAPIFVQADSSVPSSNA
jgi:hypothetical protein